VLIGAADTVNSVACHPDGTTLAAGGDDNTIRSWTLAQ
jgi:WD40 repeat protein